MRQLDALGTDDVAKVVGGELNAELAVDAEQHFTE